jgi:hypothetical protein
VSEQRKEGTACGSYDVEEQGGRNVVAHLADHAKLTAFRCKELEALHHFKIGVGCGFGVDLAVMYASIRNRL